MRISVKLTAGVLVIAALVALVGYLTNLTDHTIQAQIEHLSRSSLNQVVSAADMAVAIQVGHDALHDLIVRQRIRKRPNSNEPDPEAQRLERIVQSSLVSFQRSLDQGRQASRWESPHESDDEFIKKQQTNAARFKQLTDDFVKHREMVRKCLKLATADPAAAEKYLDDQLDSHFNGVLFPLLKDQKYEAESDFSHEVHSIERAVETANLRNTIATLVALLCALILGLFLSRSIGAPLAELKAAALQIGKGRLDTRLTNRSRDEIGVLAATFNRMAEDLEATTVSKAYVDNILQSMSEMLIVVDPQLQIRMVNGAALAQLAYRREELIGQPLTLLLPSLGERDVAGPRFEPLLGSRELTLIARDGEQVPVHWAGSELCSESGELQGVVCAALNIAERQEAEARLRASLDEKEVLLKEVHHRVKNNLQIISSLLALQARDKDDPQVRRMFEESQGRIRSMALIHEQLYQSGELSRIDFLEYVRRLSAYLMESTGDEDGHVKLQIDVAPVPLPLNLAIPCGMILNELVSNALKHAFPARSGTVRIGFESSESRFRLSVRDDGIGLDSASTVGKPGSLGLKVVDALTRQMGGELTVASDGGTEFTVSFPAQLADAGERDPNGLANGRALHAPLPAAV